MSSSPPASRARAPFARALTLVRAVARFLSRAKYRSELLTRLRHRDQHFQAETHTEDDRYPALFLACANLLAHVPAPAILSFGCSTGAEVFSLARYLPHAFITGVDINRWVLRQAACRTGEPRLRFLHRFSPEFAELSNLDAIFCMAVFQRTEHRNGGRTRASGFTFRRFEQELFLLDAKLKPGGLLFLDHADFRFEDSTLAARYQAVDFARSTVLRQRPIFRPDNTLERTEHLAQRCFRKQLQTPLLS